MSYFVFCKFSWDKSYRSTVFNGQYRTHRDMCLSVAGYKLINLAYSDCTDVKYINFGNFAQELNICGAKNLPKELDLKKIECLILTPDSLNGCERITCSDNIVFYTSDLLGREFTQITNIHDFCENKNIKWNNVPVKKVVAVAKEKDWRKELIFRKIEHLQKKRNVLDAKLQELYAQIQK